MFMRMWGKKWALIHCWWECKLEQPLWKTIWRLLKKLNIDLHMIQQYHCRDIPKGMWHRLLQRHLHTHVYCSSIHDSQAMETAKVPH
jgi:hypothetical protein